MAEFFNILLVDDDPDDHQFFRMALRELRFAGKKANEIINVSSVFNGIQALEYLLKKGVYKNTFDPTPNLIVLDLNMPVMDGLTVLKEIKRHDRLKSIPVYILTTSSAETHMQVCTELGCAGFFSKPPAMEELGKVLDLILKDKPYFEKLKAGKSGTGKKSH